MGWGYSENHVAGCAADAAVRCCCWVLICSLLLLRSILSSSIAGASVLRHYARLPVPTKP
jgi:hypothetical protein